MKLFILALVAVLGSVNLRRTVDINPGDDWNAKIAANAAGTAFIIKAGTHYQGDIVPKAGDTFTGELSGSTKLSTLSGGRLLTSFSTEVSGGHTYYKATGQTQQGTQYGECLGAYPACNLPEEMFVDGTRLTRQLNLSDVTDNTKWYFNYSTDSIYLYDNPSGHTIVTSVQAFGIHASGSLEANVTVKDLIVEHFANLAQVGALMASNVAGTGITDGWVFDNIEARYNHGVGLNTGLDYIDTIPGASRPNTGTIVRNCYVHHNGQLGVGGAGDGILVTHNEISYNCVSGFDPGWEGGGTKFAKTRNATISYNYVHDNTGPGLWDDVNNIYITFEWNRSENNSREGIVHEISYDAIIRYNCVYNNGANDRASWLWGAGIGVHASPNVEVYGNLVVDNQNGIAGIQQNRTETAWYGSHILQNLDVHDNTVYQNISNTTGGLDSAAGVVQDVDANNSTSATFTSRNNVFTVNTYYLLVGQSGFQWKGATRDQTYWQGTAGFDTAGTFNRGNPAAPSCVGWGSTPTTSGRNPASGRNPHSGRNPASGRSAASGRVAVP